MNRVALALLVLLSAPAHAAGAAQVSEPSTLALVALGILGVIVGRNVAKRRESDDQLDLAGALAHAAPMDTLQRLEQVIAERSTASPDTSYVAQLNARGLPVIARKLGEEAVEAVIAALASSKEELTGEAADVIFHLLVLLNAKGVTLADVLAELDRREGTSGLEEKAARN